VTGDLVAITGGTGFLGRRLIEGLLAEGRSIRALVRRNGDAKALASLGLEPVIGDLESPESVARLVADASVVIHGAGLIKARNRGAFFSVNEDGARRIAQASRGHFILISSLAARESELSDYAASKRAGEEAVLAFALDRLTIVRPPAIYGPGDRETLPLFQAAGAAPVLPLLGGPNARLALAHVDDVVATIAFLAERRPSPGPWAVGGARPEGYTWAEILNAAGRAMGRAPKLAPLPSWLIHGAGSLSESLGRFSPSPPIFNRGKARELLHPDWSVAPRELAPGSPAARFTLEAGFADTVAWYRSAGWL
jgi:nucleoside-diphosphate-sugar epimerase